MTSALRLLILLVALVNLLIGLAFLIRPADAAAAFALSPIGTQGLATLRADFPAFFLTGGLFALIGAWRRAAPPLLVPITLLGIALFGRIIGVMLDGIVETTLPPMVVEAVMLALLWLGWRSFKAD